MCAQTHMETREQPWMFFRHSICLVLWDRTFHCLKVTKEARLGSQEARGFLFYPLPQWGRLWKHILPCLTFDLWIEFKFLVWKTNTFLTDLSSIPSLLKFGRLGSRPDSNTAVSLIISHFFSVYWKVKLQITMEHLRDNFCIYFYLWSHANLIEIYM